MSYWLTDPELFLYAKGIDPDDVHLWRCKKPASSSSSSSSSSLVVPMESDDFDYVSKVKNHLELIVELFDWDETDYKRLVKYIYEKHLLVNSQGFVIVQLLHEADKNENKKIDDANEEEDVPAAIYIRSLDVLALKAYIPKLRERPIPLRTVKYLGDLNGKAAMMEEKNSDVVTKLIARVDDLESKNKTLEGKVTKLAADLVTKTNALATLQQEVKTNNINAANTKEVWMNDITISREWVGVEGLVNAGTFDNLVIASPMGKFTVDDSTSGTNILARYWYEINVGNRIGLTAISLEALIPNKEKARFSQQKWSSIKFEGKTYVYCN